MADGLNRSIRVFRSKYGTQRKIGHSWCGKSNVFWHLPIFSCTYSLYPTIIFNTYSPYYITRIIVSYSWHCTCVYFRLRKASDSILWWFNWCSQVDFIPVGLRCEYRQLDTYLSWYHKHLKLKVWGDLSYCNHDSF